MRDQVIQFASTPTTAEAAAEIEALLERYGGAGATIGQTVDDIHADRR